MNQEILKVCKHHGEQPLDAYIKSGKSRIGTQLYKCKKCVKAIKQANYKKNKEAINARCREWKLNNPDRAKDLNRQSYERRITIPEVREKRLESWKKYRTDHHEKCLIKERSRKQRYREGLELPYVKDLLTRKSLLSSKDIPAELAEIKQITMLITREIKNDH